jgi:hypothetical protein
MSILIETAARMALRGVTTAFLRQVLERTGTFVKLGPVPPAGWWTGRELLTVAGTTHATVVMDLAAKKDPRVASMGIGEKDYALDAQNKAIAKGWVRYQLAHDPRFTGRASLNYSLSGRPHAFEAKDKATGKNFIELLLLNDKLDLDSQVLIANDNRSLFRGTVEELIQ